MVRGLNVFREHFSVRSDRFILIGGTACDLIFDEAGIAFRATKDLDIVLCIESVDIEFAELFWAFVKAGGYRIETSASGRRKCYRFQNPSDPSYPVMLELFSRNPDSLSIAEGVHLTPIPIDGDISSLSAILLDEVYYSWIQSGRRLLNQLRIRRYRSTKTMFFVFFKLLILKLALRSPNRLAMICIVSSTKFQPKK